MAAVEGVPAEVDHFLLRKCDDMRAALLAVLWLATGHREGAIRFSLLLSARSNHRWGRSSPSEAQGTSFRDHWHRRLSGSPVVRAMAIAAPQVRL